MSNSSAVVSMSTILQVGRGITTPYLNNSLTSTSRRAGRSRLHLPVGDPGGLGHDGQRVEVVAGGRGDLGGGQVCGDAVLGAELCDQLARVVLGVERALGAVHEDRRSLQGLGLDVLDRGGRGDGICHTMTLPGLAADYNPVSRIPQTTPSPLVGVVWGGLPLP